MSTRRTSVMVLLGVLVVVGCGGDDSGATSTSELSSPASTEASVSPPASWMVGERSCEEPGELSSDDAFPAEFVEPVEVHAGDTVTVRMNQSIIEAALGEPVEAQHFGGDYLFLQCWDGSGWVPTWLVRLPGFSDAGGSYPTGVEFDIVSVSIEEPYDVELVVPAGPLPPGQYRWSQEVAVVAAGELKTVRLVQPFSVLP